ncbi:MAG TPA: hypothetical protein VFX51_27955 [Solirubrobacteraceae bacterium]|nr:hypothetical protein [Solirubrobacteraceae bacterium]
MKWLLTALSCLVLVGCGSSSSKPVADSRPAQATSTPAPSPEPRLGKHAAREECQTQSGAEFSGAYTDPNNLVVGPLSMIGGAFFTDAATVRAIGGQKYPLLVRAGHTVTVSVAPEARAFAGLAYGPLPQGKTKLHDSYRAVTFVACSAEKSISSADGLDVTFWSGAVLTRRPACVPLQVAIDGGGPQRVGVPLGVRC